MESNIEEMKPLEFAILKGIDYSQFWPNPNWREFGDLDCLVLNDKPCEVVRKARENGFTVEDDDYKHARIFYKDLVVENHNAFTEFAGSKENIVQEKELKALFTVVDKEGLYKSPSPNFTALFLVTHAQNHLFNEGITLKHILDWYFFLKREKSNVDWTLVDTLFRKTKIKAFADILTRCVESYLGLNVSFYHFDYSFDKDFIDVFISDLFSEKRSKSDRRWFVLLGRILNRFKRMIKLRKLMRMPIYKAIWITFAYSSFLHRKPELK